MSVQIVGAAGKPGPTSEVRMASASDPSGRSTAEGASIPSSLAAHPRTTAIRSSRVGSDQASSRRRRALHPSPQTDRLNAKRTGRSLRTDRAFDDGLSVRQEAVPLKRPAPAWPTVKRTTPQSLHGLSLLGCRLTGLTPNAVSEIHRPTVSH